MKMKQYKKRKEVALPEPDKKPEKKSSWLGETTKYFLISLGIFLIIIIFASTFFKPDLTGGLKIKESPIAKNKELAIKPGETYVYNYRINNTDNTLTFAIKSNAGCTFIQIKESTNITGACVDKNGNDKGGSNVSLEIAYISMFKPWMLAVEKDWKWNARMVIDAAGSDLDIQNISFKTIGEETLFGRESYVVEITDEKAKIIDWVDKEKRILIKEQGSGYKIELITAPFELNKTN